jgi:hypothetical protein
MGKDERIYFLAPIPGLGPELPYGFGDESRFPILQEFDI